MPYKPTNIGVLIQVDPKLAADTLLGHLKRHHANLSHTAKALKVDPSTVHRWLDKLTAAGHDLQPQLRIIRAAVS